MSNVYRGEYIYLSFYFNNNDVEESLLTLAKYLASSGAELKGACYSTGDSKEADYWNVESDDVFGISFDDLDSIKKDPHQHLVGVYMNNITSATDGEEYESIGKSLPRSCEKARLYDHSIIQINTAGYWFSEPLCSDVISKAFKVGESIYKRFIDIAKNVEPLYGAITHEYTMENPTELKYFRGSIAFEDFFLHKDYIGEENLELIRTKANKAYHQDLGVGQYTSSWKFTNPKKIDVRFNDFGINVGNIIADRGPEPQKSPYWEG